MVVRLTPHVERSKSTRIVYTQDQLLTLSKMNVVVGRTNLLDRRIHGELKRRQCGCRAGVTFELFNAQSLTNKSFLIHDHILDEGFDITCLNETWHRPEVYLSLIEACTLGYTNLESSQHWPWWWFGHPST